MLRSPLIYVCLVASPVGAAPVSPADVDFFEKQIRPVLSEQCWSCHGPKKQTAGLRLDSRAAMLKGGENGPAIDEKEPAKSLILKAIRREGELKMPPKTRLPPPAIDAITAWVNRGAPWPEATAANDTPDWRKHWAFQPVTRPEPPGDDNIGPLTRLRSPIDRFVIANLKERGLSPS